MKVNIIVNRVKIGYPVYDNTGYITYVQGKNTESKEDIELYGKRTEEQIKVSQFQFFKRKTFLFRIYSTI